MRNAVAPVTRSGKSSRSVRAGLHIDAVRIAAGAAPIGGFGAQQLGRIEVHGVAMIGIHVLDGALLGLQQRAGVGNIGQKLLGLEVHDPPESSHQMCAGRAIRKNEKSLKFTKASAEGWALR